ncbi:CubicO group peptidase (beta-lactamase class C family) [Bacillus tianshenii]|uniref:CubicO group peptidase (Beta-lactamase class C family) n=1 Tax=Sutcliffiella tianshenii TaxID=1463404 RepID=A0ABS2NYG6_9BACI|nr:serine hydrolase domain-containing protein [Bacillus tianshenii]MBM7619713.1 CubicO group peptidase (beta-lactamase class C family) [Bacillus tianshenii]
MTTTISNINKIIHNSMQSNNLPAAAFAILQNNEVTLSKGYGKTHIEDWATPVTENTLFRIASVSKLFTGTVIMMLVEKGVIDLDKPVQHYVPWFVTADAERSKEITVRMLVTHSSGLPTGGDVSFFYKESGLYDYMKEVVPTLPVLFRPGTAYSYGNHALNIAGFVAETVTGVKFADLMQEMLFNPLEMTQTTYHPLRAMTQPLSLPHDRDAEGSLTLAKQFFDNSASYPSYYAFSSIKDLTNFALMHLQDGMFNDKQILSAASIQEMRKEQSKWYTTNDGGCGITFFKETKDGIERFWHYGQYSYQYSSQFILVPEKGIAVIALANGENIFQAGYEIVDELLKDEANISEPSAQPILTDDIDGKAYEGTYLHSYHGLFEITELSGKLLMKHRENSYELKRQTSDIYSAQDENGNNVFSVGLPPLAPNHGDRCIVVDTKACPEFELAYTPNPSDWHDFIGTYSDGTESYEVELADSTVIIKDLQNNKELIGRAIEHNRFLTREYGLVSFIDIKGVVTLEFDYAWRYSKQKKDALVVQS